MKSRKVPGSFFKRGGRWYWQVRLPGQTKYRHHPLIPSGSRFATADWPVAEEVARHLYQRATLEAGGVQGDFDGTVSDLAHRFMEHARTYYIDPHTGEPSREVLNIKYSAALLTGEYALLRVDDFGPARFKALRERMVRTVTVPQNDGRAGTMVLDSEDDFRPEVMRRKYSRGCINQRMGHIKRIFAWGVEEELVPGSVHHALLAVRILAKGRTLAREGRTIEPVDEKVVRTTMKYASPTLRTMLALQLLTGARPGEICIMRAVDLDRRDPTCWWYRPFRHKCERWGHERTIPILPEAQRLVEPYLTKKIDAYLFSPKVARQERYAAMRTGAGSPSQQDRRKDNPQKKPGDFYDRNAYYRAIQYAIRKGRKAGELIPNWHPNQIRHTVATLIEEAAGADAARALLGHRTIRTTQIYVKQDAKRAVKGAQHLGMASA